MGHYVETKVWRPFFFGIQKNFWGTQSDEGKIQDLMLVNISFLEGGCGDGCTTDAGASIILGGPHSPDQIKDFNFVGLSYYGKPPETSLDDAGIDIIGETDGVHISSSAIQTHDTAEPTTSPDNTLDTTKPTTSPGMPMGLKLIRHVTLLFIQGASMSIAGLI